MSSSGPGLPVLDRWLWILERRFVSSSSSYEHYSEKAVAGLLYALINHVYWVRLGQIDDYGDGYCFLEGMGIKTLLTVILAFILHLIHSPFCHSTTETVPAKRCCLRARWGSCTRSS